MSSLSSIANTAYTRTANQSSSGTVTTFNGVVVSNGVNTVSGTTAVSAGNSVFMFTGTQGCVYEITYVTDDLNFVGWSGSATLYAGSSGSDRLVVKDQTPATAISLSGKSVYITNVNTGFSIRFRWWAIKTLVV